MNRLRLSIILKTTVLFLVLLSIMIVPSAVGAGLTITEVRNRAVEYNRTYLSAKEDVALAQSEIVRTRADALPNLHFSAGYTRTLEIPSQFVEFGGVTQELRLGLDNSFNYGLTLEQPIWHGGKVFTAYSIAREYKKYAEKGSEAVKASVIETAEILFYSVALEKARLQVFNRAYEANSRNFEMVEMKYSKGLVSRYEYLRAQVERDNLLPLIIKAESDVKLAEKKLKSFIGIDLNEEISIVEEIDDTSLVNLPALPELTNRALEDRPEMTRAEHLTAISKKAIRVAKGGFLPDFDAFMAYGWSAQSNDFTLDENTSRSWTAGVTVNLPIFNGGRTFGDVSQRQAQYRQSQLAERQTRDDIRLEVEAAYDALLQAKKSLDIQGLTIAQAEEGLKIANLRYESGVGTQLEVLSAQAALTDARSALAEALFMFRQAKAGLKKATTLDI
ncbi:MAG: TolC family protein [Candidatus Zixiibacteriota bacterium]